MNTRKRDSWKAYFLGLAKAVASRSTCLRRQVGCVLVKDNRILATGYNGAPKGLQHCSELKACLRDRLNVPSGERHELCRAVHAEQNAIAQAATYGIAVQGADIYCSHKPCSLCAKLLINCGIKRIFYAEGYPDDLADTMLSNAGIVLEKEGQDHD